MQGFLSTTNVFFTLASLSWLIRTKLGFCLFNYCFPNISIHFFKFNEKKRFQINLSQIMLNYCYSTPFTIFTLKKIVGFQTHSTSKVIRRIKKGYLGSIKNDNWIYSRLFPLFELLMFILLHVWTFYGLIHISGVLSW